MLMTEYELKDLKQPDRKEHAGKHSFQTQMRKKIQVGEGKEKKEKLHLKDHHHDHQKKKVKELKQGRNLRRKLNKR